MRLKFDCHVYRCQLKHGGVLLHEHPRKAASWREPCIQRRLKRSDVHVTKRDQCEFSATTAV